MLAASFAATTLLVTLADCGSSPTAQPTEVLASTPTPDPIAARDAVVAKIYDAAKRRDEAGLTGARDDVVKAGGTPDPAIALALYVVDRDKYRDAFVAAYPSDYAGVDVDYGPRLDRAKVVPGGAGYPIQQLGSIAVHGDPAAQRHLLLAMTAARGPLADAYAREAGHDLAALPPELALAALTSLPVPLRLAATAETDWCRRKTAPLLSYVATPTPLPSGASPTPLLAASPVAGASPTPPPAYVLEQQHIRDMLPYCTVAAAPKHHRAGRARHRGRGTPNAHAKATAHGKSTGT